MSSAVTAPVNMPYWVAHLSPDAERAKDFYGALFGWAFDNIAGPDAPPFYIASSDGDRVASLTGPQDPATWIAAVAVKDLDQTRHAAVSAGGTAPGESVDITTLGRFHRLHDPAGVEIHVVQPTRNGDSTRDSDPVTGPSITLADASVVARFYETLFGWQLEASGPPTVVPRPGRSADRPGHAVGGEAMLVAGHHAAGAGWAPVFWVEDLERRTAAALTTGARLLDEAAGSATLTATLADPDGATFVIAKNCRR